LFLFTEIFAASLKLVTADYILISAFLLVTGSIFLIYLNQILKLGNVSLVRRYEKSNLDLIYELNSVLLNYKSYSDELFRSYSACPQVILQNISSASYKTEETTGKFAGSFKLSEKISLILNNSTVSTHKYFTNNINAVLNNTSLAFMSYSGSLAEVNSHIKSLAAAADDADALSRSLRNFPDALYFEDTREVVLSFKEYIDKYSYLISSAETNFSTLQNLHTDELKHEVSLVSGQLTENLRNYGVSVNSSVINVIDEFNISLEQFVNRSNEYISSLKNSLSASSLRTLYGIETNIVITPVRIEDTGDKIIVTTINSANADYFLTSSRNVHKLYPSNLKNENFNLLFSIEGENKFGNVLRIEPAECSKINDTEFELIKKGILYFK
jgi:hypothetical protein